jgi:D-alanyl-D-alanine carboxypeptidase
VSAHRTYDDQSKLWDKYSMTQPGRAARPGHSEHEAGLAVDVSFAPDAAGDWTAANAWQYGFVLSYPQYEQKTTGFRFEPWHFRFVGSAVAADLHDDPGLPLEEYFRMSPGLGVFGDCSDCTLPSSRADCGALTLAGRCDGNVLAWCFDGTATAVDCAVSGLACAADPADTGADCVDPP